LDKALDECSYYRFTFLAAGLELEEVLATTQREFNSWLAQVEVDARNTIIKKRMLEKSEDKIPAS